MTRLLTVAEYAREKGVTTQSVYNKIRRGTLKIVKKQVYEIRIPVEDTEAQND